jgi:hypothetical protein
MILTNNVFWYLYDSVVFFRDPSFAKMKPHMYDNWFSKLLMKNPTGICAWYDMFTIQGYLNWLSDSLML